MDRPTETLTWVLAMLVTKFSPATHSLSDVMDWARSTIGPKQMFRVGFQGGCLVFDMSAPEIRLADLAITLQVSDSPFPL